MPERISAKERATKWAKDNKERRREINRKYARKKHGSTEESLAASNTYKARKWEEIFAFVLGANDKNAECFGSRYDLDLDGLHIDVKICQRYFRKTKRGKKIDDSSGWWVFQKNKNIADAFLCACLDGEVITKLLLIPNEAIAGTGITVGVNSSYDKYAISLPSAG